MRFFLFLYSLISFWCYAQSDSVLTAPSLCKNAIYLEGIGNTSLYALNYDRILYTSTYVALNATVGATYVFGEDEKNRVLSKLKMPAELNHAKYIVGGTLMLRKELFWKWFNIQKVSKDRKGRVSYAELGFFHVWNDPKISPSNKLGGTLERGSPWNNIYLGYNFFKTKKGLFLRFGIMLYMYKKGANVINETAANYRISPLPFPRGMVGYTF